MQVLQEPQAALQTPDYPVSHIGAASGRLERAFPLAPHMALASSFPGVRGYTDTLLQDKRIILLRVTPTSGLRTHTTLGHSQSVEHRLNPRSCRGLLRPVLGSTPTPHSSRTRQTCRWPRQTTGMLSCGGEAERKGTRCQEKNGSARRPAERPLCVWCPAVPRSQGLGHFLLPNHPACTPRVPNTAVHPSICFQPGKWILLRTPYPGMGLVHNFSQDTRPQSHRRV